jgi:hypothetical protein
MLRFPFTQNEPGRRKNVEAHTDQLLAGLTDSERKAHVTQTALAEEMPQKVVNSIMTCLCLVRESTQKQTRLRHVGHA